MSKKGNNKETPEWVDRDDNSSVNVVKNKFTSQEERPQQNTPKVYLSICIRIAKICHRDFSFFICVPFYRPSKSKTFDDKSLSAKFSKNNANL